MDLVSRVVLLVFSILNVLLELRVVLIFHRNLLNVLLWRLVVVWVHFQVLLTIIITLVLGHVIQIPSLNRLSTLVLWLLCTHDWSWVCLFVFFLHACIQLFSFFKDFHKLAIHFITIKLFQNVLLMIELILWLLSLLGSLLFLDESVSVFWSWFFNVLSLTLSSTLSHWLCVLMILVLIFYLSLFFPELVFVILNMHTQTLIWKSLIRWISWILLILLLVILWNETNCTRVLLDNCWLSGQTFLWRFFIWLRWLSKLVFKLLWWELLINLFFLTYLDIFLISSRQINNVSFIKFFRQ